MTLNDLKTQTKFFKNARKELKSSQRKQSRGEICPDFGRKQKLKILISKFVELSQSYN